VGDALARRFAQPPDSVPIVRASFDTRTADTAAWLKVPPSPLAFGTGADGTRQFTVTLNPLPQGDDWALLADGTIAIVRVLDYHIDWYHPDGTRSSSERLPFAWKRIEDADKARIVDSLRGVIEQLGPQLDAMAARRGMRPDLQPIAAEKLPDYYPPIRPGGTIADRAGNLWILPATSAAAAEAAQRATLRARFARRAAGGAADSAAAPDTAAAPERSRGTSPPACAPGRRTRPCRPTSSSGCSTPAGHALARAAAPRARRPGRGRRSSRASVPSRMPVTIARV
jgi:hypothetical protein